jgi:hypothetical protein
LTIDVRRPLSSGDFLSHRVIVPQEIDLSGLHERSLPCARSSRMRQENSRMRLVAPEWAYSAYSAFRASFFRALQVAFAG